MSFLAALTLLALGAQEPPPPTPTGDPTAYYVVRTGDSLEALTAQHLGDASRWRENWALNKELKDPHQLRVGQRIVIIVGQKRHRAQIQGLSRTPTRPGFPHAWGRCFASGTA
jgi:LysM repeat protein